MIFLSSNLGRPVPPVPASRAGAVRKYLPAIAGFFPRVLYKDINV